MDKYNRNYIFSAASKNEGPLDITVTLPITIEFDITQTTLTSANVCQIRLYNLSAKTRNLLRHDSSDYGNFKSVVLNAGYGNNMPLVFSGNISQAWSVREGVNFITQIECFDGGFAFNTGKVNMEFPSGTTIKAVILAMAATLPNIKIGAVGDFPGVLERANSYSGNTMQILTELTGGGAFIYKGKFYALGTNEYVQSLNTVGIIGSQSGLLGTPVLENHIMHFDMIFEPGLSLAQVVQLDSSTAAPGVPGISPSFNGIYVVKGVKHKGLISSAVCGSVITTGQFFYPTKATPSVGF